MGLIQIALIWGAASSALFHTPSFAGEWEHYQDLKSAMVRSKARSDVPLPIWASSLVYPRPSFFYDLPIIKKPEDRDAPLAAPSPAPAVQSDTPR